MKSIGIILLSLILMISSCLPKSQSLEAPKKMVDLKTYQTIAQELLIIEAKKNQYDKVAWEKGGDTIPLFPERAFIRQALKRHGLTEEEYKAISIYYGQDLAALKTVYDTLAKAKK
jgi:hypothetical protein